jgi:photosystem II stability/assembly factor-like uncharacterized protein
MLDLRTDTVHRPLAGPATECLSDARWGGATLWELGTTRCALHPRQSVAWTGDLGRTWSARTEHHPVLSVQVAPHRTAILVGGPTGQLRFLDVTDDAGASWHRVVLPQPIIGPNAYATTPDGHLFVAAGSHVYASTSSWTSFHPVAVPGAVGALDITAADGVISVVSAGSDRIAESYDDGQTWHQVSPRPGPTS